jgi:CRP/FNR family transcriptional regulator
MEEQKSVQVRQSVPDDVIAPVRAAGAMQVSLERGHVLFRPGDACQFFPILLAGAARVELTTQAGRDILLYEIKPGETCVMSTSCLLGAEAYAAQGSVVSPVEALLLSASAFDQVMAQSAPFRRFVLVGCTARLMTLMQRIEALADIPLPVRLAAGILQAAGSSEHVMITHRALAITIGSAREVVSRTLEEFARQGLVALARGQVTILDRVGLERRAQGLV